MNLTSRQSATAVLPCPEELQYSTQTKQITMIANTVTQSTKNNLQTQRTVTKQKHTLLHTNQKSATKMYMLSLGSEVILRLQHVLL